MQVDLPITLSRLLLLQMKSGKKRNLLRFSVLALALGTEYIGASQSKSRLLQGQCQKQVYSSEAKKRGESIVRSIEV